MKRLLVIMLFLLLGAIVNVAVAWGCVIYFNFPHNYLNDVNSGPGLTTEKGTCWGFYREDVFGSTFLIGTPLFEDDQGNERFGAPYSSARAGFPRLPAWSQFTIPPTIPNLPDIYLMTMIEESRGWPFRALSWYQTYNNRATEDLTYCVRKHVWTIYKRPWNDWLIPKTSNWVELPLAPIWGGFTINTIFYASLFWLLVSILMAFRRIIRRKRGLCVKCAYDLRGAEHEACPECGLTLSG